MIRSLQKKINVFGTRIEVDKRLPQEMLDEVCKRMTARGVVMDRGIFDESAPVVRLLLSYDIARYVFGPEVEFKRRVESDKAIASALELVNGVKSQQELLNRALTKQQQQKPASEE